MLRLIGASIAGIIVWVVTVTLLNLGLRHGWQEYAAVEQAMTFAVPMMVARLLISGVSSLASGAAAARLGRSVRPAIGAGFVVLIFFLPVHYTLWDRFPIWYHLTFLGSLPLLGWLGGRLACGRQAPPPSS